MLISLSGLIGGIASGTYVGFYVSVFVWITFIVSLGLAVFELIQLFAQTITKDRATKMLIVRALGMVVVVASASGAIAYQLGYHGLSSLVSGVGSGVAPLSLLALSSILTGLTGLTVWTRVRLLETNDYDGVGGPVTANVTPTANQSLGYGDIKQLGEVDWASQKLGNESREMKVLLGREGMVPFLAKVQIAKRGIVRFDKDALQTRNNVEQWITFRLETLGPTTKRRLEAEFEKSFPNEFVSLFNSVLYDMHYRNKILIGTEGETMVIGLPAETEGPSVTA